MEGVSFDRRQFIAGSAATLSILGSGVGIGAADVPSNGPTEQPFDGQTVRRLARQLAQQAYKTPDHTVPAELAKIDYDAYRSIRYRADRALWRGEGLPFEVQFFHRGWIFKDRIQVYVVDNRVSRAR